MGGGVSDDGLGGRWRVEERCQLRLREEEDHRMGWQCGEQDDGAAARGLRGRQCMGGGSSGET